MSWVVRLLLCSACLPLFSLFFFPSSVPKRTEKNIVDRLYRAEATYTKESGMRQSSCVGELSFMWLLKIFYMMKCQCAEQHKPVWVDICESFDYTMQTRAAEEKWKNYSRIYVLLRELLSLSLTAATTFCCLQKDENLNSPAIFHSSWALFAGLKDWSVRSQNLTTYFHHKLNSSSLCVDWFERRQDHHHGKFHGHRNISLNIFFNLFSHFIV